ncbi:endoribonuclease Dicer [Entomortierella parvispora]|uniref:Endoribonuclease Dicer n=1 Tax=Entomortierella parvispora TaxID=205924 RepID=A0A9P3M123_9FUNG|nr:endoribonuclease Dicer [Entomortierella parvispora]
MSGKPSLRAVDQPRDYQLKIANLAVEGNVIAVADTGSGKTLISVMLLRAIVAQARKTAKETGNQQRVSFFVVNKVPLVFQQYEYIENNSDIKVEPICGAMGVDNYDEARWNAIFAEREVIVLTGQILFDIFQCAFLKIQECDLIIFDECHHATKEHNYRKIMTDFYDRLEENERRPKIFGMTASPPKDKGTFSFSAVQLEDTLSADIYTAAYSEVVKYTQRPEEREVWFHGNPTLIIKPEMTNPSYLEQAALYERLANTCPPALRDLCEGSKHLRQAFSNYLFAQNELGPWCAAKIWQYAFEGIDEEAFPGQHDTLKGQQKLQDLQDAKRLALKIPSPLLDKELTIVTEKLKTLLYVLRQSPREGFCGILFVERRPTAHVICDFLNECKKRFPGDEDQGGLGLDFLRPVVITGHGSTKDILQLKMQMRDQKRALNGFRKDVYNLLVATDVAEEGLDIRRCRLVVRFDNKHTLISFIQSRGRARDPNSDYVIMQRHGDESFLEKIRVKEQQMRDWCGQRPEDRVIRTDPNYIEDITDPTSLASEQLELQLVESEFFVPSTGARLSFSSAIDRLYRYCSSLPGDAYTTLAPEFKEIDIGGHPIQYQYRLTLPPNVPVTEFLSDTFMSKRLAKRSAAFKACKMLFELGLLSDRMLPHKKQALTKVDPASDFEDDNEGAGAVTEQANVFSYPAHQPDFWDNKIILPERNPASHTVAKVTLYGTILTLRPMGTEDQTSSASPNEYRSLILLTKERLPQFDPIELFFNGASKFVDLQVVRQPIDMETPLVLELYAYAKSLFTHLFHKEPMMGSPESGMRHIIAPLRPGARSLRANEELKSLIDWAEVKLASIVIAGESPKWGIPEDRLSWDGMQDAVLFERGDTYRFYFPLALRNDLTPTSLIPRSASNVERRESGLDGVMTFASLYKEKRDTDIQNLNQPIIEVERVQNLQDHLQPGTRQARSMRSSARFLIPELCQISHISASVLRSSSWAVSVLDRLDGLLKAKECLKELGLQKVETSLVLEALTSSDAGYKMNYQRLELLGDTFLKFVVSVDLFIRHPLMDEGQLTEKRTGRITNDWLFKRSEKSRLDRYIVRKPRVNKHFHASLPTTVSPSPELPNDLGGQLNLGSQCQDGEQTRSSTFTDPDFQRDQSSTFVDPLASELLDREKISKKTMADMVEALLGAAFLSGDMELGLQATKRLVYPLHGIDSWSDFPIAYIEAQQKRQRLLSESSASMSSSSVLSMGPSSLAAGSMGDLSKIETTIGYRFKNRLLLEEALTHASWPRPRTPCYQRLEFLGDSILDMLVAHHWVARYPVSGPGMIHEIKSASVNNQILGVLCVELGLHRHIMHASSSLASDIGSAVGMIQEAKDDAKDENKELEGEYWSEFVMAKPLGDVLESVLGAVLVDSYWDFAAVKGVFERTILPVLGKHISMETLKRQPVAEMFRRIAAAGCQEARLRNMTSGEEQDGDDSKINEDSPLESTPSTPLSPSPTSSPASPALTRASSSFTSSPELPQTPPGHLQQKQKTTWKQYVRNEDLDVLDDRPAQLPQVQDCALVIHGKPVLHATNLQVRVARRNVANEALVILHDDPTWLDLYCDCRTRISKRQRPNE